MGRTRSVETEYDVIVVGGGTAGVVAAIQAGRAGARTLLVEKNGILGGTMTVGGVNFPAHFFAWGRPIIAGIGWELVRRTFEETGQPIPDAEFTRDNNRLPHLRVDRTIFAAICDEVVLAAGVEPLLHAMPAAVAFDADRWRVTVCGKTGLHETSARVLIDATGDANVVSLAGFELVRPDEVQPATLVMHCSGYDPATLDYEALTSAARRAIDNGELLSTDISWHDNGPKAFLSNFGCNANHIRAHGAETSSGRTAVEFEGRRGLLRMYRFFRRQPGLENFRVDWVCDEAGIRETVTIRGKATLRIQDYEAGTRVADALCYAFYPVDEHLNDGRGIHYRLLEANVLPTIPRGALLPAGSRFLIVAGRSVASDRETNSAVRVECPCMAMGQAAGAMAALSAARGVDPAALPLDDLYALLRSHGAIVPGD